MKGNPRATSCLRRRFRLLASAIHRKPVVVRSRVILFVAVIVFATVTLYLVGYISRQSRRHVRQRPRPDRCQSPIVYQDENERQGRPYRFPSVDERIRLYMSNWYRVPCAKATVADEVMEFTGLSRSLPLQRQQFANGTTAYRVCEKALPRGDAQEPAETRCFRITNGTIPARVFYADALTLQNCAADADPSNHMRFYCKDMNSTLSPLLTSPSYGVKEVVISGIPLFYQFGDATESRAPDEHGRILLSQPRIPHLKKFRLSISRLELGRITRPDEWSSGERDEESCTVAVPETVRGARRLQPIIWKLNVKRHFGYLYQVPCSDSTWESKKDQAIFRGKLNGDLKKATSTTNDPMERCMMLERCRLVWQYKDSGFVDARLTSTMNILPNVLRGVDLTAPVIPMKDVLSFKGIIVLEGNDVSSGLKNALLSSSVVLMPQPLFTSWAMEEMLEPWIHYIPLLPDLSDVESKVKWMLEHGDEAQRISYRASLWIKDLVFHPKADEDEERIMRGILQRYSQHFALETE